MDVIAGMGVKTQPMLDSAFLTLLLKKIERRVAAREISSITRTNLLSAAHQQQQQQQQQLQPGQIAPPPVEPSTIPSSSTGTSDDNVMVSSRQYMETAAAKALY